MQTSSLRLHGWPLVAVNYVIGSRSEGLRKLRFKDKKILASFIGAYMPHYINEDRLKIVAAGRKANRDDVIIDLVNEWHFNKTVYKEQVTHKALTEDESEAQRIRTLTYNSILTRSKFSLCPIGSGPNTLRLWESIAIGTIPVLFSDDLAIFHESDEGKQLLENCILWQDEINESLFEHLAALPAEDMSIMQDNLMVLYEHFSQLRCFAL